MPLTTKVFGIERVELIHHLQQSAAEGAKVPVLFRVLALRAAFFNALEVDGRHKFIERLSPGSQQTMEIRKGRIRKVAAFCPFSCLKLLRTQWLVGPIKQFL